MAIAASRTRAWALNLARRGLEGAALLVVAAVLGRAIGTFPTQEARAVTAVAVVAGIVLVALTILEAHRRSYVEGVAAAVIFLSGLVDIPRSLISFGPVSGMGGLTALYAVAGAALLVVHGSAPRLGVLQPFFAYLVWAFVSITWHAPTLDGLQNIAVMMAFVTLAAATAGACYRAPEVAQRLWRGLGRATWVAIGLYLISVVIEGLQADVILHPRGFALFAMLGQAWSIAKWRSGSRTGMWTSFALLLAIMLSLSRTAFVVALLIAPLAWLGKKIPGTWIRITAVAALAVALFIASFTFFGPLRDRFNEEDKLQIGGITVSGSGRAGYWATTWESWLESPLTGHGAGSAMTIIRFTDPRTGLLGGYTHPHNDYLRILHDYGVVGMTLWGAGLLLLLRRIRRSWVAALRDGDNAYLIHVTAFLAVLAVALTMITDNPIVYVYVMAPLGVAVGASLGLSARRNLAVTPSGAARRSNDHLPAATRAPSGSRSSV